MIKIEHLKEIDKVKNLPKEVTETVKGMFMFEKVQVIRVAIDRKLNLGPEHYSVYDGHDVKYIISRGLTLKVIGAFIY
jgi:hypothetical protein